MDLERQRKLKNVREIRQRLGELLEISQVDGEDMLAYLIDLAQVEAQKIEADLERPTLR